MIVSGFVFNIMKKSIPLKEIVGFLPYKMNCLLMSEYNEKENFLAEFSGLSIFKDGTERAEFIGFAYTIPFEDFKPIVHPLSDLTKEITHNGETFVPALELVKLKEKYGKWKDIAHSIPYEYKIIKKPFGNILKVTKLDSWVIMISLSEIERSEYFIVEKLKEWHFDIYDWIKDGLAVDINTL